MRTLFRIISFTLLLFNGLGALYGGWSFMTEPSGQGMQLPLEWMADTVFEDYFIPGLVLFTINGLFNIFVMIAIVMRLRWYAWLTMAAGIMLCIWLTVQIEVINLFYPPLHILYYAIGLALIIFGYILSRPEKPKEGGKHGLDRYHRLTKWIRPSSTKGYPDHIHKEAFEDIEFLKGPRSRFKEFVFLIRVFRDFIKGFRELHFAGPCVTIFGSARFDQNDPHYKQARKMGAAIAQLGFTVMTGGGPGIMEAANRGAKDVGGRSVGCNIILPVEQGHNPFLDRWVTIRHFFVRKVLLSKYSYAFVVMPGGLGTMDELFEALTLIQTGKIERFPVVLIGKDYYRELMEHIEFMATQHTIDKKDLDLFLITDSVEEATEHIKKNTITRFGLVKEQEYKPLRWLGERALFGSGKKAASSK
ncbi:MAG: TIGR00730 family Rossman fold protein [Salibacteraceae bacterium]